ncbi:type III toxin-antitoxin system ToxN/AbiQ family toxin [[Clostridium] innocuum]|nr:type III toxin-antitoxin system ToxN/AbiQ family toxin [[Clostridium] innocuum]
MKLYIIDESYIKYLHKYDSRVSLNHDIGKTRKYICVKVSINQRDYFVPMSSPDNADFFNGNVRKSFFPVILRLFKVENTRRRFFGKLLFNKMIPCAKGAYEIYDLDNESDVRYKNLIIMQLNIIRKEEIKGTIQKYADTIYTRKLNNFNAPYILATLDFFLLEKVSKDWENNHAILESFG